MVTWKGRLCCIVNEPALKFVILVACAEENADRAIWLAIVEIIFRAEARDMVVASSAALADDPAVALADAMECATIPTVSALAALPVASARVRVISARATVRASTAFACATVRARRGATPVMAAYPLAIALVAPDRVTKVAVTERVSRAVAIALPTAASSVVPVELLLPFALAGERVDSARA